MIPGRTKASLARFFGNRGPAGAGVWRSSSPTGQSRIRRPSRNTYPRPPRPRSVPCGPLPHTKASPSYDGELQRREPDQRPQAFEPDLFRARFVLLRREDNLTEAHRTHLETLFEAYPRLKDCLGRSPRDLPTLYEADDLQGANQALARFADLYDTGQTPRIPRRSRHHHCLWWKKYLPTTAADGHQQMPSSASTASTRVLRRVAHGFTKPRQLCSPRHPPSTGWNLSRIAWDADLPVRRTSGRSSGVRTRLRSLQRPFGCQTVLISVKAAMA